MKILEERAKEYSLKDFDGYYTGREKAVEKAILQEQLNKGKLTENSLRNGTARRNAIVRRNVLSQ